VGIFEHDGGKCNSIAGLAQHHLPKKSLHGQNTGQMLERLKAEKNINWDDCPNWYKWGSFIKKDCFLLETETPQKENSKERISSIDQFKTTCSEAGVLIYLLLT